MKKKHFLNLKKVLLVLALPILSVPFALFTNMLPVSAAGGSYSNLGIDNQIKAFEYYAVLTASSNTNACVPNGSIQNADIANFKFFMNDGQGASPTYDTGSAVKVTRDFDCTDKTAMLGALQAVGISTNDPGQTLCLLGYTQTEAKGSTATSCGRNAKLHSSNDTFELSGATGFDQVNARYPIVIKALLKNSTVFAGTAPTWTDAMKYESTLNDFEKLCNGTPVKGSTYNVTDSTTIAVVGTDGKITTQLWSYTNHPANNINYFPLNLGGSAPDGQSCAGVAANLKSTTSKYIVAYQQSLLSTACITAYPDKASDPTFLNACAQGVANPTNYVLCSKLPTAQYVGSTLQSDARNACFLGQNLPVDANGTTAGELCMALGYRTDPALSACINGAINRGNPAYCSTTYYTGYHGSTLVNQDVEAAACKDGLTLKVADSTAVAIAGNNGIPTAGSANVTSCVVDGIGWMVCPLMNAIGGLNDAMYAWIQSILVLNPLSQTTTDSNGATVSSPQYDNWSNIRNIANVLLVIGFLAIIFSQISSVGISNYGVKKMLPRIVLVAVGINLSWIIMSLSVDIVNVVGVGLHTLLDSTAVDASAKTLSYSKTSSDLVAGTGIAAAAAAGGIFAAIASSSVLSTLVLIALPFLLGAVLALLAAVATLFLRNALVIVLVIIAPVAIAASILPNTEQYFKSWRKLFLSMLFLFPMAALLFSGAKFAAYVMITSNQPMAQIIALFVMAAPLGMLPWLARSSGGILSTVNSRLGSMAKSVQGAAQRGLKDRIETGRAERRTNERDVFGRRRNRYKGGTGETHEEDVMVQKKDKNGKPMTYTKGKNAGKPIMTASGQKRKVLDIDPTTGLPVGAKLRNRNFSQMLAQSGERLKTRTATAQQNLKSDTQEVGLGSQGQPGQPRTLAQQRAANVADVFDRSKVAGLRNESIEAQYKGRLEVAKLTDGETRAMYDRLKDAGTTTHALEQEQTLRQTGRIKNNAANTVSESIGLSRLENISADDGGNITEGQAARLRTLSGESIGAGGGGGLKILHESQETAEFANKNLEDAMHAEFEQSKLAGGTNTELFAESLLGKAASDKIAAQQKRIESDARLGRNSVSTNGTKIFTQEVQKDAEGNDVLDSDGRTILVGGQLESIRDLDQDTQAESAAAAWADGGKTIQYAKKIEEGVLEGDARGLQLAAAASGADVRNTEGEQQYEQAVDANGNPLYEKNPDGSDNLNKPVPNLSRPKVAKLTEAKAAKAVLEDKESDQATIVSLAKSRSMPNGEALTNLGVDIKTGHEITPPAELSSAEKLGYLRYAAGRGDRQTSMSLVSHVGRLGKKAKAARKLADASPNDEDLQKKASAAEDEAKESQKVLLEAGDSSLPPWLGGSDKQKLAEGTFDFDVDEAAISALASGKMTADAFSAMDVNNRDEFVNALDKMSDEDVKRIINDTAEKFVRDSAETDHPIDINTALETARQNFAQAIVPIDKAEFDVRLNRGLAPRDHDRYNNMRDRLRVLSEGRTPTVPDAKTGNQVPYKGYTSST